MVIDDILEFLLLALIRYSYPVGLTCSKSKMETPEQYVKPFKVNNKTPKRRHRRHLGVFFVSFGQISPINLVFLLLTLNKQMLAEQWA